MSSYSKRTSRRSGEGGTTDVDRRSTDRHLLTASAEVIEMSSGARFTTRTTDLGPGGCFIDTVNPLPVGAKVRVAIRKGKSDFRTPGTVVYSQHGLGMGISFDDLDAEQRHALNLWIKELSGQEPTWTDSANFGKQIDAQRAFSSDRTALIRLVQALVGKGILSPAEGAVVLDDSLF
ncbi:MAG TPA: PilZ domain-containing protein [Candidatus Cybelea sp.]|nr:PilZ domain-containing protein [Candidatus Cybelea sp.]